MSNQPADRNSGQSGSSWAEAERQRDAEVQKAIQNAEGKGLSGICSRHHYWGPWLLIRCSDADKGARPAGPPTYTSPDILIESSDPQGRAVPGEPNFVWARVWNLGRFRAAPVKLDFYWANPAVGLGPGFVNPISGNSPEWVQVPPLSSLWVKCQTPWIPTYLNNGHECLFVNCDDYLLDPIVYPSQPVLDRHAGQRNITVIPAAPGEMIKFNLEFNNIFPYLSTATLSFRSSHLQLTRPVEGLFAFNDAVGQMVAFGLAAPAIRASVRRRQAIRATRPLSVWRPPECDDSDQRPAPGLVVEIDRPDEALTVATEIGEHTQIRVYPGADAYVGELFLARNGSPWTVPLPPTAQLQQLAMRAFEQRQLAVEITVPGGAQPGEFFVCHVTQDNDGIPVGGYAIVIHIVQDPEHRASGHHRASASTHDRREER
jgi:hypothetical protein